jgi:hypothetical protein
MAGARQVNRSRKPTSGPFSFRRENPISNSPPVVAQDAASTDTTAVYFRSSVGGRIAENATSFTVRAGLHSGRPTAGAALTSALPPASKPSMRNRVMLGALRSPERLCGFAQRLFAGEPDVGEQVLVGDDLAERDALGAALSPPADQVPGHRSGEP